MRIRVKLFGTLRKGFPNHDSEQGLEVVIPDGASVEDLLAHLEIRGKRIGMVSVGGRVVRRDAILEDGELVRVFQPIFGG
jgi:sulfur carrier protein ThiS